MVEGFGDALRVMREAAGLSLAALAERAAVSKSHLGNLETGDRPPTVEVAEALDRSLRAGGVLVELAAYERGGGDDMRRRALLSTVAAASTLGLIDGPHALADMVLHDLLSVAGVTEDWDGVVQDCSQRLVTDPSPLLGTALLTGLSTLRQEIEHASAARKPDLLRAAAGLSQIYGLWLGNVSQVGGANQSYRAAGLLADRSGDTSMRAWVRGRAASRGVYESWSIPRTLSVVEEALSITDRPTAGMLEAHAARVSVAAIVGDPASGRAAIRAMADTAERLPASELHTLADPVARTLFMSAFLEARVGSLADAEAACEQAEDALQRMPTWLTETQVYRARAMVAAGDTRDGLAYALRAVQGVRHDVRVIAVAVRDVLFALPRGHRSEAAEALRPFAATEPGPWETLAV
jgi:DNA-binding XRE family transcriptional regulator